MGFRYFTQQTARRIGIIGEVWNRTDGSVEVFAQHPDSAVLEAFAAEIERGPGYVRDVQIEPAVEHGYREFSVGPTR